MVPADWVEESTALDTTTHSSGYYSHSFGPIIYDNGNGYYKCMWYGKLRDGQPADFAAEGDHGQVIYVSPASGVIIVRNGTGFGMALNEWTDAFYQVAGDLQERNRPRSRCPEFEEKPGSDRTVGRSDSRT